MRVRSAVIPVAGMGTRLLPATKAVPKAMLPVVDKPVIQYIVEEAAASGIEQVVVVLSRGQQAIVDHFDRDFELEYRLQAAGKSTLLQAVVKAATLVEVVFVRQPAPLGNGHAVLCARQVVGDAPFAMLWGDGFVVSEEPCLAQMLRVFDSYQSSILAAMRVPREDWDKFGMIDVEPSDGPVFRVRGIVEKPAIDASPSDLAQVKGCILMPEIFELLAATPPKKGGEIWLIDAIHALLERQSIFACTFEGRHYDTGNVQEYLRANIELALDRPEYRPALLRYLRTLVDERR